MNTPGSSHDALTAFRDRNILIQAVRDQLKGTGLDTRELTHHLAISTPGHPERGRIYIAYDTGEISHRRTTWQYLGNLHRHTTTPDPNPDPDEPTADITTIINILTTPATPPHDPRPAPDTPMGEGTPSAIGPSPAWHGAQGDPGTAPES
jgi:hypothetical protein